MVKVEFIFLVQKECTKLQLGSCANNILKKQSFITNRMKNDKNYVSFNFNNFVLNDLHWSSKNSKTYFIVASKRANKRKTQKLKENVSQEPEPNVECVESDVKTKSMETASQEKCKKTEIVAESL